MIECNQLRFSQKTKQDVREDSKEFAFLCLCLYLPPDIYIYTNYKLIIVIRLDFKELIHMIMEAKKFLDVHSASWRTRVVDV